MGVVRIVGRVTKVHLVASVVPGQDALVLERIEPVQRIAGLVI